MTEVFFSKVSPAHFLVAIFLVFTAPAIDAAVLVNDNFDSYANQAALEGTWTPIGTNATAPSVLLSTTLAASAPKSVAVPGSISPTPNGQYRNRLSFAETSTQSSSGNLGIGDELVWSFDYYDSQPAGTGAASQPQRNYANLQDGLTPTAVNQIVGLGLNNNRTAAADGGNYYMARVLGYTPTHAGAAVGDFFKLNDVGAPLRSPGWNNLKVQISTSDALTTDFRFYVNNTLAKTLLGIGNATQIRSYDNIAIGSGLTNGNVPVNFDNMRLEYVALDPFANRWLNPAGGEFGGFSNWSKGLPPSFEQTAIFNLGSTGYIVSSSTDVFAPGQVYVQTDRVSFDFGSSAWINSGFSSLSVGEQPGSQGELTITSGDLDFNELLVGHNDGNGQVAIAGPNSALSIIDQGSASNNLRIAIGRNGTGEMSIFQGGSVSVESATPPNTSRLYIGVGTTGNGLLEVRDPNSTLETGGLTVGGQGGVGELNVLNGGAATIDGVVFVAENPSTGLGTAQGVLEVSGAGSVVSSTAQIQVGRNGGSGSVLVSNGGRLESSLGASASGSSAIIATLNGTTQRSDGEVLITGAGSTWMNNGLVVVGWDGDGTLRVEQGGNVHSKRGQLGRTNGGVGNATISGTGSNWEIEQDLSVGGTETGSGGTGTLAVSSAGRVNLGQTLRVGLGSSVNVAGGGTIDVGQPVGPSLANAVNVGAGGTLTGTGSIVGNVVATGGLVRPVWALTVNGSYTQSAASTFETRVGGLVAGAQYDRITVTGSATLAGQLDVPIIGGFVPQLGDSITILNSPSITGKFAGVYAPDLPTVSPNLALAVVQSSMNVQLQFVAPQTDIQFAPPTAVVDWANTSTWSTGAQPDSRHVIQVGNIGTTDQRVQIENDDALVHELVVDGSASYTTTVAIENGRSLSATRRIVLNDNAVFDLGSVTTPGQAQTPDFTIGPGARLRGTGGTGQKKSEVNKLLGKRNVLTVKNLGRVLPGRSVGQIEVDGDYIQETGGTLEIELASSSSYDKFIIEGDATLAGTLDVVLLNYTPQLGDAFDFIDWESVTGTFDNVNLPSLPSGLFWNLSQLYVTGSLSVSRVLGDYNLDGFVDAADYTVWRDTLGQTGLGLAADGDLDGAISQNDYNIWRENFGSAASTSFAFSTAVPEPTSAVMAIVLLSCLILPIRKLPLFC